MIKIDDKNFFLLYACCVPVKGAARSIICDLQKNTFTYITNDIFEMLRRDFSISEIKNNSKKNEFIDILNYLKEQDVGFYTSNPENFPSIDLTADDFPEIVKNSIIDFDKNSSHNLQLIIEQLSELQCSALELRFFDMISHNTFMKHLSCFEKSTVRTLHVVLKYAPWTTSENIDKILLYNKRLVKIIIHSTPNILSLKPNLNCFIHYTTEDIKNSSCCGYISPYYFQSNIDFFKEALVSNTCLDKKICIDSKGYIKNCPAMSTSFGHISNTKLCECLENDQLKKISQIKKDDIEVCKDCEFRYMCMDCRAFTTNNLYSKPLKCGYDPYKNTWN